VTKSFQLVAGHPALDLVNTLDWRFRDSGAEELLGSYEDLLRFAEQSGVLSQRQARALRKADGAAAARALQQARDLRESLAQLIYAMLENLEPPVEALLKLDRHLHVAQSHRALHWSPKGIRSVWPSENDASLPVWLLAESTAALLTSESADSIRECANAECRWLFLDLSRNHTRRWCDMKICGNRTKARRHREQRTSGRAGQTRRRNASTIL
jgi:predicted RNA-binding Zn ribbon-like protein